MTGCAAPTRGDALASVWIEQLILGLGLLLVGAAGVITDQLMGTPFWLSLPLFVFGASLSMFVRHYSPLSDDDLLSANTADDGIVVESIARTLIRFLPLFIAAFGFIALAAIVNSGLAATAGGLVVGQGLVELRLARWFGRWERRHQMTLLAAKPKWLFYRRDALPAITLTRHGKSDVARRRALR